jgi:hypothetical protein
VVTKNHSSAVTPRPAHGMTIDPTRLGTSVARPDAESAAQRIVLRWTDRDPDGDSLALAAD